MSSTDMDPKKYHCWCPDMGHGDGDGEVVETLWGHIEAAELYVERNFSSWDYPSDCDVVVRRHGDGTDAVKVNVTVESVPTFHGRKSK